MEAKQASLDQHPVSSWGVPRLCEQMYAWSSPLHPPIHRPPPCFYTPLAYECRATCTKAVSLC